MNSQEIFIVLMVTLLIFNFCVVSLNGNASAFLLNLAVGGILTVIIAGMVAAVASAINVLGSGVNPAGTKIIFGFAVLLGILFQLTFTIGTATIPLGMGLLTNIFTIFSISDLYGIPFFLTAVIGVVILVTGLQTITGGAGSA